MTTLSKLAVIALAALIATTSVAGAIDIQLPFGGTIKDPLAGIPQGPVTPHIPIVNQNGGGVLPFPPKPVKPYIPIINGNGGPVVPIGGFKTNEPAQDDDLMVACGISGVEFASSNDLLIKNLGSDALPAGLKLRFRVRSTGDHGAFLLPRTVQAGKHLVIADILHGAVAGAPCDAQIIL